MIASMFIQKVIVLSTDTNTNETEQKQRHQPQLSSSDTDMFRLASILTYVLCLHSYTVITQHERNPHNAT